MMMMACGLLILIIITHIVAGLENDDMCSEGRISSLNDRFVCCPGSCRSCEEVQCALGNMRCCPTAIAKQGKTCASAKETSCVFNRQSGLGPASLLGRELARVEREAWARQLLHSKFFCRAGIRGASNHGPHSYYAACCPAHCAACDACGATTPPECCPRALEATAALCVDPDNVSCVVHRHELDVRGFRGARRDNIASPYVHVVIAGDRVQALGVVASARSVFQSTSTPERIDLHVVVDPPTTHDIRASLRCAMAHDDGPRRFQVHAFNVANYAHVGDKNLTIRAPTNQHKGNLAAGPNFARFYLPDLLSRDITKVVYLDADTIVLKDACTLFDTSLTSSTDATIAVAAVSRKYKPMCGSFINCRSAEVRLLLRSQKIYDPETQLDAFNAGVMVIHLERWRALRLTREIEFWMAWNNDLPLYKLGSNPPLVLAVRDNFQHLDTRWNCQRGHACWDNGDAGALHWSGSNKPWVLEFKRDTVEWLPYLRGVLDDHA